MDTIYTAGLLGDTAFVVGSPQCRDAISVAYLNTRLSTVTVSVKTELLLKQLASSRSPPLVLSSIFFSNVIPERIVLFCTLNLCHSGDFVGETGLLSWDS